MQPHITELRLRAPHTRLARATLSTVEVANHLGVSRATLANMIRANTAPPSYRLPGGRRRLFPAAALEAWEAANLAAAGAGAAA